MSVLVGKTALGCGLNGWGCEGTSVSVTKVIIVKFFLSLDDYK